MSHAPHKTDVPSGLTFGEPVWKIAELFPNQGVWSEEEYLSLGTNRLVEFSHGYLEFLPMPTETHQAILLLLLDLLRAFAKPKGLGKVLFAGIRVQIGEGKYREPDVVFMRTENKARTSDRYWIGADLVMEIVSDSSDDRDRDLVTKRQEYAQAGIPEYWIVDPEESRITVLTLAGSNYAVHGEFTRGDQATSQLLPGFSVDVTAVLEAQA